MFGGGEVKRKGRGVRGWWGKKEREKEKIIIKK